MDDAATKALELIEELERTENRNKIKYLYAKLAEDGHEGGPYGWQHKWHNAGADSPERAIIAGNRTGKTRTAGAEVAIHLTGIYPEWWKGRRFKQPNKWIVAGPTNELTRDVCQQMLFGDMMEGVKEPNGEGWVPKSCIGEFSFRQCGVQNVLDSVRVKHVTGGWSEVAFKSYEQGNVKFQGVSRDGVWLDEEPTDSTIFTECQTRVLDRKGLIIFSRTPLFGMSDIIRHFISGGDGIFYSTATWEESPHLNKVERDRLYMSYPEHERATRAKGVPMMGSGGVYTVADEEIMCDPFEIPSYYRRIVGIDFGIDHPAAAAWIAFDADTDVIYVTDCYKKSGETALYHANAISQRGDWIPVAWPHDGMVRDKGGGVALKDQYMQHGCNMLPESARYDDYKGGGQSREPITIEILERMRTGRFKVFRHLHEWFEEKRMLHRKDGRIVPEKDDIESATRYAVMSLRYATSDEEENAPRQEYQDFSQYDPLADFSRSIYT